MDYNRIYQTDVNIFRFIHIGLHHAWLDPIFFLLTWCGDGGVQALLIFLGLLSVTGKKLFWPLMCSLVLGGIAGAQVLKHLLPRQRPSNLPFAHPQELIYSNSFPSGHTTSSMAIAIVLFLFLHKTDRVWLGYLALGMVPLIGLSRIYRGVHWPTDVLGGALCGAIFGSLTYLMFKDKIQMGRSNNDGIVTELSESVVAKSS